MAACVCSQVDPSHPPGNSQLSVVLFFCFLQKCQAFSYCLWPLPLLHSIFHLFFFCFFACRAIQPLMMLKAGEGDEEAGTYVTDDRSTGSVSLSVPLNSARPKSGELQATAKGLPVWPLKPPTPVHHLQKKKIKKCKKIKPGSSDVCQNTNVSKVSGKFDAQSRRQEGVPVTEHSLQIWFRFVLIWTNNKWNMFEATTFF